MHFLPDVYVPCEQCHGKRYNRETLDIRFKGKTIADVLEMSVEEALEFFKNIPKIKRRLQTLHDVGLDYIRLGQPATTLSGGEAQRVKLSSELSQGRDRRDALHPRRADHRPSLRRRAAAARRARPARRRRQHGGRDRAQPRRDQDRRLDHRPRPRGRRGGRASWSRPARRSRSRRSTGSYTGQFLREIVRRRAARSARAPAQAPLEPPRACKPRSPSSPWSAIAAVWGLTFVMVQDAIERAAADGVPRLPVHPGGR